MRNHLVRRQTLRSQGPVLLYHTLGDDPPLLGGLLPDFPLDHLIPVPANFSAVVESVSVGAALSDEGVIQYFLPDLWRQHLVLGLVAVLGQDAEQSLPLVQSLLGLPHSPETRFVETVILLTVFQEPVLF